MGYLRTLESQDTVYLQLLTKYICLSLFVCFVASEPSQIFVIVIGSYI